MGHNEQARRGSTHQIMLPAIKKAAVYSVIFLLLLGGVFLFSRPQTTSFAPESAAPELPSVPEPERPTSTSPKVTENGTPKQDPLPDPPVEVRAIYLTGWTAGSANRLNNLIAFAEANNLNGMVIDIKDYSGYVSYRMEAPEIRLSGAENELRIGDINAVIKKLHEHNLYAIARVSVFQDPILAKARPDLALKDSATGETWQDRKGLSWLDPAAEDAWKYNLAVAQDALSRGFDEINFDYIRFPSDGNLESIEYPFWNEAEPRRATLREFFKYLRDNLPQAKLSADLFGLATYAQDDLGIGQVIEDAYMYFDFVSPMVYPSHYAPGVLGFKNPAEHPYEIVSYSLAGAKERLEAMFKLSEPPESTATSTAATSTPPLPDPPRAKLRPWLQVFNLGAVYDPPMVAKQIRATEDVLRGASSTLDYAGWLLWDPRNVYAGYRYADE